MAFSNITYYLSSSGLHSFLLQRFTADFQDKLIMAGHQDWSTTSGTKSWTPVMMATRSEGRQCRRVSVTVPGQGRDPLVSRSRVILVKGWSMGQCHACHLSGAWKTLSLGWGMSSSSRVMRDSRWTVPQSFRVSRMGHWATLIPSVSQVPALCPLCEYKTIRQYVCVLFDTRITTSSQGLQGSESFWFLAAKTQLNKS